MKGFFGGIMMAIGILIAALSGLCTGALLLSSGMTGGDMALAVPMVLMFGGIPFLFGLGLFFLGRAMVRSYAAENKDDTKDFE